MRFLLLLLLSAPVLAADQTTLLFVDDHDILYRTGTERVLVPLKRHVGNPVIRPEHPWESLIAYCTVARDEGTGRTQAWYQSYAGPKAKDRTRSCTVSYAESADGVHFTKPMLELFPFDEVKRTNIVLVANGGTSDRYANSVLVDPADPNPNHRYKMGYFDFAKSRDGKEYPGLNVAFSPDGVHWTKHDEGTLVRIPYTDYEAPVPLVSEAAAKPWQVPMSMADAVDICYDPVRRTFVWYGKMWIDGPAGGMAFKHAMGRCESKDFVHWSRPQLVCAPDDKDPPTAEFHTSPVFYHAGVYFCLNQILDRATDGGVMNVELMTSRDGVHWDRNFRNQWFLPRNPVPNAFDSGSIFTNSTPIFPTGSYDSPTNALTSPTGSSDILFYYGGYAHGATGGDDSAGVPSGIGLATLPLDRFAGIRPLATTASPTLRQPLHDAGQVTLKPLDLSQVKSITLNADASHGSVRVELLTEDGYRVPGYTADDAVPVVGDSLRHTVAWKSKSLTDLPAGRYMLRLHLRSATAYALTLTSRPGPG